MKKLDINTYLVNELSNVLHNDDFVVSYLYRHNKKPSIIIKPWIQDSNDIALCELKQLCSSSSQSLGPKYLMSLEHILLRRSAALDNGKIRLITLEVYELTMPKYDDFKSVVKQLEARELDNNIYSLKAQKGGVKK